LDILAILLALFNTKNKYDGILYVFFNTKISIINLKVYAHS
jgi:hypothetical protein